MPKFPDVHHLEAIRVFEKIGFYIKRQSKHIVMTNGFRVIVIPRGSPINAFTMAKIIEDAGLTLEEFRQLL